MKYRKIVGYLLTVIFTVTAWWLTRHINPGFVTLIAIMIMLGSTIWFFVSLISKPQKAGALAKSWWKTFWDGFWGLG